MSTELEKAAEEYAQDITEKRQTEFPYTIHTPVWCSQVDFTAGAKHERAAVGERIRGEVQRMATMGDYGDILVYKNVVDYLNQLLAEDGNEPNK